MPVKRKKSNAYFSAGLDITADDFTRINNNTNGNPRYVIHFLRLLTPDEKWNTPLSIDQKYSLALKKSKAAGGKKYSNKSYGGGIAFESYNIENLINKLNSL